MPCRRPSGPVCGHHTAEAALAPVEQAPVQKCADLATLALPIRRFTLPRLLPRAPMSASGPSRRYLPRRGVISPTWILHSVRKCGCRLAAEGKSMASATAAWAGFINYAHERCAGAVIRNRGSTDGGHVGGPPMSRWGTPPGPQPLGKIDRLRLPCGPPHDE